MRIRGRKFFFNRYRALELSLAANRRTVSRPEGLSGLVDNTLTVFKDLQLGFEVLNELINNSYCDDIVLVPDNQF